MIGLVPIWADTLPALRVVDEQTLWHTHIRIRATTIRDFDRNDPLVPNKKFTPGGCGAGD